jgi:hypothetical protein
VIRVAYQVHSHRNPQQVHRLVARILHDVPDAVVVISHDRTGPPLDEAAVQRLGDVHVLRHRGGYGDWTHVQRWLDCVDYLVRNDVAWDWMATLSGQDYPLRDLADVQAEIAGSDVDAYLEWFEAMGPDSHWPQERARTRYLFRHYRLHSLTATQRRRLRWVQAINMVQPLVRVNVAFGLSVGRRTRPIFDDRWRCMGGSFWTTMSRPCAEYVRRFAEENPAVVDYYQHTLAPEESFFQTVLCHAPGVRLTNDAKRYFDFSDTSGGHPRVLGPDDLVRASASGAFFARKFDGPQARHLMDLLDREVA